MSEYIKQNLQAGQVLKASQLDHIECGILAANAPCELIATYTFSTNSKLALVNVDSNNTAFSLSKAIAIINIPDSSTSSGIVKCQMRDSVGACIAEWTFPGIVAGETRFACANVDLRKDHLDISKLILAKDESTPVETYIFPWPVLNSNIKVAGLLLVSQTSETMIPAGAKIEVYGVRA